MFITLLALLILISVLGAYVAKPLFKGSLQTAVEDGFHSEDELGETLKFRDELIQKLIDPASATPERVAALSEDEQIRALVRVCATLKSAGMPYLPSVNQLKNILGVCGVLTLAWLGSAQPASGQPAPLEAPETATQPSPDLSMPELAKQEDGTNLGQIHQFILSPDQGMLRVYYLSLFSSPDSAQVQFRIPSPDGASDFDFSALPEATLVPNRADEPPVLEFTASPGINQVRGLFTIPAFTGVAEWQSSFFENLPGVVLFILPEYSGILTSIFGESVAGLNLWPPRVTQPPAGFTEQRTRERPNQKDPNFARMKNPPNQYSWHYLRRGPAQAAYPTLTVSGLAPSRLPGILISICFGMILLGFALASLRIRSQTSG